MLRNRNTSNTSNKQSNARRGRIPQQAKEVQCAIMDCILSEMEKTKEDRLLNCEIGTTERKVNYGIAKAIIEKHKRANPWLNRDVLNNYKRLKERAERPAVSVVIRSKNDNISDLTDIEVDNATTTSPQENVTVVNEHTMDLPKKGGRPKGTTKEAKRSNTRKMQQALNHAATEALSIKEDSIRNGNARVQKGTYKKSSRSDREGFRP